MKILVCIAKTPDTTSKISFTDNNTVFNESGVVWIINPYDEWYALVRALELKEAGICQEITLITVGNSESEAILRKALALGGDKAIRVDSAATDPMIIAEEIAKYAATENFDMILTGKESIDYNNASVGGMLAELLNYNYVPLASKLDIEGNTLTLEREIEGGTETIKVDMPIVVSAQKGMAEQRIPNMRGIMAARTKPLEVLQAGNFENLTNLVSFETPPEKSGVKLISADNVGELVKLLHEEAKVI